MLLKGVAYLTYYSLTFCLFNSIKATLSIIP